MKILTSNKVKIEEIKRIVGDKIEFGEGKDLPEVDGNIDQVILYKSLEAGKDIVVEDTILALIDEDGNIIKEIVDIKWKINELKEGQRVKWITSLGYNDGKNIKVYRGFINGVITKEHGDEGFAFDPYFIPSILLKSNNVKTLYELNEEGKKDDFSARKNALINLMNKEEIYSTKISEIPKWNGRYQNEEVEKNYIIL